ncbi:hypothetical protein GCM10027040_25970 [Halomonas shantousis]
MSLDQAAGLRRWAEAQSGDSPLGAESSVSRTSAPESPAPGSSTPVPQVRRMLMTVGLPTSPPAASRRVMEALERWQRQGHRWVGKAHAWRVVALDVRSPHLPALVQQQTHWALWVEHDPEGFRRAYLAIKRLRLAGGPRRLLVVHAGLSPSAGLLVNLQQSAARFLDTELLILRERDAHVAMVG